MCVSLTLITLHMIKTWEIKEVYMQVFQEKGSQNATVELEFSSRKEKALTSAAILRAVL